jgi:hypothetical protein
LDFDDVLQLHNQNLIAHVSSLSYPHIFVFPIDLRITNKKNSKIKTNNKKWILQSLANKKLTTKSKQQEIDFINIILKMKLMLHYYFRITQKRA